MALRLLVLIILLIAVNLNFLKTLYFIARVSPPYKQIGNDSKTLLILGDSTGYGTGAKRSRESVAGLIGTSYPDLHIVNNSSNGRTAVQLQSVIQNFSGSYDVILLQIGSNDLLQGAKPETVVAEIQDIVVRLQVHSKRIIVMTGGNIGSARRFKGRKATAYTMVSREYEKRMTQMSKEKGNFDFVSLFVEPDRDPFVLETFTYTTSDGLHPTSTGYALWFKKLQPILDQALKAPETLAL